MSTLKNLKVAVLATDGFEQSELEKPVESLKKENITVHVISPKDGKIKGWQHTDWGNEVKVDVELDKANPSDYQALVLPGGVMNPDKLRLSKKAISFIKDFVDSKKLIAAICHGPWTLIDAGGVKGKKMTSWPSIKTDLENAGANWVDKEVVRDGNIITSRKPDDIPAFNAEIIKALSEIK